MQTEFTSINFDNEDVDMIKVDCVSPQMIRTPGQNRDRSALHRFICRRPELLLSLLMSSCVPPLSSSVLLCPPPVFVAQI